MLVLRKRATSARPDAMRSVVGAVPSRARCAAALCLWIAALGIAPVRGEEPKGVAEPDIVGLVAADGLKLAATYYAGADSKETVPIIVLHGLGGSRADLHDLALKMQAAGHSVLAPDLRGHGDSPIVNDAGVKLETGRMTRNHFLGMLADVEACKNYLKELNNEGKLNIDRLCVIGTELGATVALNWAAGDWAVEDLPGRRQSKWVKALVLISPTWSVKGFNVNPALQSTAIREKIAMYIVSGQGAKDSTRLVKQFEGFRANVKPSNLAVREFETTLQGAALATSQDLDAAARIGQFVNLQLVEKAIPWKNHSR